MPHEREEWDHTHFCDDAERAASVNILEKFISNFIVEVFIENWIDERFINVGRIIPPTQAKKEHCYERYFTIMERTWHDES